MTIVSHIITEKQKVRDFVEFIKKPFTVNDVIESTGVKKKTAGEYLRQLQISGTIKRIMIDKGMNVYVRTPKTSKNKTDTGNWKPSLAKLKKILNACNFNTVSEIATILMINKTTVKDYLGVLYVEGLIRIIDKPASKARKYEAIGNKIPTIINNISYYREKMRRFDRIMSTPSAMQPPLKRGMNDEW